MNTQLGVGQLSFLSSPSCGCASSARGPRGARAEASRAGAGRGRGHAGADTEAPPVVSTPVPGVVGLRCMAGENMHAPALVHVSTACCLGGSRDRRGRMSFHSVQRTRRRGQWTTMPSDGGAGRRRGRRRRRRGWQLQRLAL
jgi:hypothetical protein